MTNSDDTGQHQDDGRAFLSAPIPFRGALTVEEAYEAISLAQPLGNKIAIWIVRGFFVAGFLLMSWITATTYLDGDQNLARMALAMTLLFLITISLSIGRSLWYRRRAHQMHRAGQGMYASTEGEVDQDSIRSRSTDGEGSLNWSAMCGYRNSDNVAVSLRQPAGGGYVIMARSKFGSDQEWQAFLDLTAHILDRM